MSKTIMAVGAHTGDAQLTCGMLLAKHAMAGDRVIIVDLTAGERDQVKKQFDHAMDEIRYFVATVAAPEERADGFFAGFVERRVS